jgi:hypothetical protein
MYIDKFSNELPKPKKMKKSIIISLLLLCMPIAVMAQRTLTGKVLDVNSNQPLVGATLYWKNTTAGATSTTDGSYTIR